MAGFQTKTFTKHDDYMTPYYAWKNIENYLPKDKVIWEAFYGNGNSAKYLRHLGCKVVSKDCDFFNNNMGEVIVTNPAFSILKDNKKTGKKGVLRRLKELDKPFIIIMPVSKIVTRYFAELFAKDEERGQMQYIIPRSRINFKKVKYDNEKEKYVSTKSKNACNFDCYYYCYKMNLPMSIVRLGDNNNCKKVEP